MNNKNNKKEKLTTINSQKIKLFEAFAGIGSQFKALKNIQIEKGWEVESVGIIEWFIPAIIGYQAIHYNNNPKPLTFTSNVTISNDSKKPVSSNWYNKNISNSILGYWLKQSKEVSKNLFDISKVKWQDLANDIDIFTYSFPCQDISNQGKQLGFNKQDKTRSGLLWEIDRLLTDLKNNKQNLPKYLLMENVKAIINSKHNKLFQEWRNKLQTLGYETKTYLLNAAWFGSCQNRERVFELSVLKTHKQKVGFEFPEFETIHLNKPIKSILDQNIKFNKKFNHYKKSEFKKVTKNNIRKKELLNYTNFHSENYIYDINYSGPTLTASGALSRIKLLFENNQIREMTPKECFRYMGFEQSDYEKIQATKLVSDNKLVYLCGNSIAVEVLEAIFRSLKF